MASRNLALAALGLACVLGIASAGGCDTQTKRVAVAPKTPAATPRGSAKLPDAFLKLLGRSPGPAASSTGAPSRTSPSDDDDDARSPRGAPGAPLVAPSAQAAQASADGSLRLGRKFPTKGRKSQNAATFGIGMHIAIGGVVDDVHMRTSGKMAWNDEVLETSGTTVTKVGAHIVTSIMSVAGDDGKEEPVEDETHGKRYTVTATGAELEVRSQDGATPSEPETESLRELYRNDVGKPDLLVSSMPDRGLRVGDNVPELTRWVRNSFRVKDMFKVKDVRITFKGTDGGLAHFSLSFQYAMEGEMTIPMRGTFSVRTTDSWLVRASARGEGTLSPPVATSDTDQSSPQMTMRMNISVDVTTTY